MLPLHTDESLMALLDFTKGHAIDQCGTSLHLAADGGHLGRVQFLVERGSSVDVENRHGVTPIAFAAARGHFYVVKFLINAGARVDAITVHAAATGGITCLILLIRKAGVRAEVATSAMHDAASEGRATCMKLLIVHGLAGGVNVRRSDGARAIHLAAQLGHEDCVRVCIVAGADVDARDGSALDATPLHRAAMAGHVGCIKRLIEAGADLDAVTSAGRGGHTALRIACEGEHLDCVKALLEADATIDIPDGVGETSIQYVLARGMDRVEAAFRSVLRMHVCGRCRRSNQHVALKVCKRCRATWYCDTTCQAGHWAEHKGVCKRR